MYEHDMFNHHFTMVGAPLFYLRPTSHGLVFIAFISSHLLKDILITVGSLFSKAIFETKAEVEKLKETSGTSYLHERH